MLAIFLDVHNEIREMSKECDAKERKIKKFQLTTDAEDKDSHMRAIAGCIHVIYTGMEKVLQKLVKHFDGEAPVGADWHIQLLRRAKYPNEGVRPAIISEETFRLLDILRGVRHVFRGVYLTNLIPDLVIERARNPQSISKIR